MTEILYFNTGKLLNKGKFELLLAEHFMFHSFIWISDFYSYAAGHEIDDSKTYISLDVLKKGYKYEYSVFDSNPLQISLRAKIEILKRLSAGENAEILSTDDEVAPFSRVLIEPGGTTSTVQTRPGQDLTIDCGYNFPFGDFRTAEPLTETEKLILKDHAKSIYTHIVIEHSADGPIINGTFDKAKKNYPGLREFGYHYEIRPTGKNEWIDKEEKSVRFAQIMEAFRSQITKDLCIFPRNFSTAGKNGGEEYCILITAHTQEKILYKQRDNP